MVLSATLTSAGASSQGATQATVEGPADSLPVMVDRLTGQLLAGAAGVRDVHGASLTTSSLDALKGYLDGQAAFRGGQYQAAARYFSQAIGADSGFTLAAFGLVRTDGWGVTVTDLERLEEIAWDGRSRLSLRDRTLLEAYLGPRGPETETNADVLRARERAVSALPDQADAWVLLGDTYYRLGSRLGFPDAAGRAARAFERALVLDPTYVPPLWHLTQLATRDGDTTEIRRLWQSYVQLDSTSFLSDQLRFMSAVALTDEEMRADALDRLAGTFRSASVATYFAQMYGGAEYLDTLTAIVRSRARTQDERTLASRRGYGVAMNRGRPREASGLAPQDHPEQFLDDVLYWNRPLEDTELVLQREDATARAPLGATAAQQRLQLVTACRLARWRLAHGETRGVASLLQRLEAGLTMGNSVVPEGASPVCTSTVRAMLAVRQGRTNALALTERVDSILASYPTRIDYGPSDFAVSLFNLMVADLFEELGQPERALAAIRRVAEGPQWLSTKLYEEGRLAALTGDREGAIEAYTHYLELRSDPEPELLPEVQAVRDELARLLGELE